MVVIIEQHLQRLFFVNLLHCRKPDKLTILRMAVSHMKQLRGAMGGAGMDSNYKPSFLTDQVINLTYGNTNQV